MAGAWQTRGMSRRWSAAALVLLLAGWEPFRSPNPDVEAGNKALEEGRIDDALSAYDRAARDGNVDPAGLAYDRGTATLRKARDTKEANERERLTQRGLDDLKQAATSKDAKIRAQANFNRGNTLLDGNKLEESIEAYKQALRDAPQMEDARLNLELALKRREKQQQQQQQQGQGQGQGQQGQGQNQQGQQGQQGQQQGQQGQQQQQQQQQQGQGGQQQQQPQQGQGGQDQQKQQQQQDQQKQKQQQQQKPRRDHSQPQSPNTPTDGKLDDLESFSRSLQRDGARRKASGKPKDPGKDW